MGLLNKLFGSKKETAKELMMDENKRMALWNKHLANFSAREELSKHFNFANVDKALQDFATTRSVLEQIEALISPELVHINDEKKDDSKILADLNRLKSNADIEKLSRTIVSTSQKLSSLLKLFREIFSVLKIELHLIRLIQKKPKNAKLLLLRLFGIIFHQEARLLKVFMERSFYEENKHIHAKIIQIARAVILEEEVKEEMETDEEKFARMMVGQMAPGESKHRYRKLGEDIFLELAEMAGAPMPRGEDISEGIKRMEEFMKNDALMHKIVKKFRPKYNDTKIRGVILAFRRAYNLGHFEEMESEFVT